jgi:hypothetical protein
MAVPPALAVNAAVLTKTVAVRWAA